MSINETTIKHRAWRVKINNCWNRFSYWVSSEDVECNDGDTVEDKIGNFKGLTTSTNVTTVGYGMDASVVGTIVNNGVAKLTTARSINGMAFNGTANINNYTTCSTAASTVAKTATLSGFSYVTGAEISIKFTYANTVASPTLNINGLGAKTIMQFGTTKAVSGQWVAGDIVTFKYDGSYFVITGAPSSVFQSVSDGKSRVATALTNQGVSTNATASFATMVTNVATVATNKYNTGYNAGVIAADSRVNTSSASYSSGYSYGYNDGKVAAIYYQDVTLTANWNEWDTSETNWGNSFYCNVATGKPTNIAIQPLTTNINGNGFFKAVSYDPNSGYLAITLSQGTAHWENERVRILFY